MSQGVLQPECFSIRQSSGGGGESGQGVRIALARTVKTKLTVEGWWKSSILLCFHTLGSAYGRQVPGQALWKGALCRSLMLLCQVCHFRNVARCIDLRAMTPVPSGLTEAVLEMEKLNRSEMCSSYPCCLFKEVTSWWGGGGIPFGNKNRFQKFEFSNSEVSLSVYTDLKGPHPLSCQVVYRYLFNVKISLRPYSSVWKKS